MIVYTLSMGLHYTFQRTRIQQFVLYQHDLQIQHELEIKSSFDSLTGLLNRGKFFTVVTQILRQRKEEYMALCLFDLDGFKEINDGLGHQMGDKAIQMTGSIIIQTLGLDSPEGGGILEWNLDAPFSIAGRLGGDEFIVLLRGFKDKDDITQIIKKILSSLNDVKFDRLEGIHASIGVTLITDSDRDIDGAYKRADDALYCSKRAGKNRIHFSEDTEGDRA